MSEKIWTKIGMAQSAYYQVDALGIPFAGGGLNAGLRDLARFAARGVFGQTIYIDSTSEMVIVRLASGPIADNSANDPWSLPAYEAVAKYLSQCVLTVLDGLDYLIFL